MFKGLLLLVILLLLRFYHLDARPPHHDESVNGWFVDGLFNRGYYIYDPSNYHGPLFFYILAIFVKIFGRGVEVLRIPTVILGSAISFTPFLFRKWLGKYGTWIAAFALTVSPALIFYSRYAIHETAFALSCILFFYFWLGARAQGFTQKNCVGFGLSLGAMATLKENFALFGASLLGAETVLFFLGQRPSVKFDKKFVWGFFSALLMAIAIIVIFFTGLFQDTEGIPNFFKAFFFWSNTGEKGNGHEKVFWYWETIMLQLEWFAGFGFLMIPFLYKKASVEIRLLSFTAVLLWFLYTVVHYKTPWCILSFYWGFIFVGAYGIGQWLQSFSKKTAKMWVYLPLTFLALLQLVMAYDVSYANPDQDGHLYIYGQTYHDMVPPMYEIVERGTKDPTLKNRMKIIVVSAFTWPLPYVLGEFKQTSYYGENNAPPVLDADEIILDKTFETRFASRIQGHYERTEVRSRQWANPIVFLKRIP